MATTALTSDPWILAPFFRLSELACPCCKRCEMNQEFMDKLRDLRIAYGEEIHINSGFRCIKHNVAIGGKQYSEHLNGNAIDIRIQGLSSSTVYKLLSLVYGAKFLGVGIAKTFIHIDNRRGEGKYWTY